MNDCLFRVLKASRRVWLLLIWMVVTGSQVNAAPPVTLHQLKCDNALNPLGIDATHPQFSWEALSQQRGIRQTAYQVLVADTREKLTTSGANIWNSGRIADAKSAGVRYEGRPLESRKKYFWKVRAWYGGNAEPVESEVAHFEMGLLNPADWTGDWVGYPSGWIGKVLYFRRVFSVGKEVKKARAYMAGIGYYELQINGKKVGDHVLDPVTSDYSKTVYYTTYDIKELLKANNVMVISVASGWYGMPKLRMQVEIEYTDGSSELINSSSIRNVTLGPVRSAGILDGEVYDARQEKPEWLIPSDTIIKGLPNKHWGVATVVEAPGGKMSAQPLEPIRVVASFAPQSITEPRPGVFVLDVGQNMAGWLALNVEGKPGTTITLKFAETIYENGLVNQENLRTAAATDMYTLKGAGVESWEPRFTYHGFRYVQVEGWPGRPRLDDFVVRKVRSDVEDAGDFNSSNELLNRIYQMVKRTEASNLHGVPTDCPQRDERMGWLNDLTVRIEQAMYNFNLHRFYAKYLRDVAETQTDRGEIADTAPFRYGGRPADPVSASFLLLALKSYEFYGNTEPIRGYYSQMKAWVDYLTTRTENGIVTYSYYGDWSPPATESIQGQAYGALSQNTPGTLISTGYLYYCAKMLAQFAAINGKPQDRETYQNLATKTLAAFNDKFWDEKTGGYGTNNQACNAFALFIGAPDESRLPRVMANLTRDVTAHGYHLTTGNLCTKYLLETLTENGAPETAYKIATQRTYPSWGYMLDNGATTLWERWEHMTGGSMNSHNHPMMGSVGSWIFKYVVGILPDINAPGFDKFILRPYIFEDLDHVSGSYQSVKGIIRSAWKKQKNRIEYRVSIPPNTIATVYIPATDTKTLKEGGRPISRISTCKFLRKQGNWVVYEVESGDYVFNAPWKK